jgi:predicted MPP superfamily phosphohydrolase
MRFDYVKRVDEVRDITRQKSWTVQPRLGATYLLTNDAKNVLRASYARLGEQVMGRDGVTTFGSDDTVSFRREYDNNLDGVFETTVLAPASSKALAGQQIAPGLLLAGVDDLTRHQRNGDNADRVTPLLKGRAEGATVLLSHSPLQVEQAAASAIGLMLSGHTHGGQIWPFSYLVAHYYPYLAGRFQVGDMTLIVSRGTGLWGPRMRLWQRGEILEVTLRVR